ncbi:hypothetical protein N0V93_006649 [Gnomoniopsis smithogilvyi]|uniref:Uncharacterized protein n=1 Tax=Gnomoniopsis smithogilvyi TaxID=1191159 RepID=A0A9W8YR51_9PEZI|nr:hypothetical protein N0V93_006649 [Gnomoniopsis smithogilvyi]
MVRSTSKKPMQPDHAPAARSAAPSPPSHALSGNEKLGGHTSSMTPTPNRPRGFRLSPLACGSPNAPSGTSGRVTESIRNGKRHVEINLVSDDDDDEDDDASPSQYANHFVAQRSDKSLRMAPSGTGAPSPSTQAAFDSTETSTHKSASHLSQPVALEKRRFTTAPQVTFAHAQNLIQRCPPQRNHAQPAVARTSEPSAAEATHPTMALGSSPSARSRPNINMSWKAQRGSEIAGEGSLVTDGASASNQAAFEKLFRPRTAAKVGSTCTKAGAEGITGNMDFASNVVTGVQLPLKTQQEPKKDSAGTKRRSPSFSGGAHKSEHELDELTFDGSDTLTNCSRLQKQKHGHNSDRPGDSQNSSPSSYQGAENPYRSQLAAESLSPDNAAPKATGTSILGPQAIRSNIDVVSAPQGQKRPAIISPRMVVDLNKTCQTAPRTAVHSALHHQNQMTYNLGRDNSTKGSISRGEQQHAGRCAHIPVEQIEDDVNDVDDEGDEHFEYPDVDYHGDDEYSPSKRQSKLRAWNKGQKKLNTETPSKDPSVPMGKDIFSRMPAEVCRRIYRELLKAKNSIAVLNGWSQVYRRQQLNLHASILGVSKKHNANANTVLYGDNVFRYILRDDARMVEFEAGKKKKNERTLPLRKQINNFRYLELEVEPNRIDMVAGMAFYAALEILVENKANRLFRLTIDLSPRLQQGIEGKKGLTKIWVSQRVWFTKAQGITDMLKQLKAHFVFFDVHLAENNYSNATSLRAIVDMRPEISDIEVSEELRKHNDRIRMTMSLEARRALARERIVERLEAEAYRKLDVMNTRLEQAVLKGAPHMVHRGWFEEFKPKRKQRKTIRASGDAVEGE